MGKQEVYYPSLDGLRALAILAVMLHHMNRSFDWKAALNPTLYKTFQLGFLGVDVFFVISGFLIAGLLLDDLNSNIRIKRFYIRRSFKIVPQYLLAVVTGFTVAAVMGQHIDLKAGLPYLLMYQNYVVPVKVCAHLWSIAVEAHFYLLYPLVLYAVCRTFKSLTERKLYLVSILLGLIVLENVLRYFQLSGRPLEAVNHQEVYQISHIRFDALLFGCLIRLLEPQLHKAKNFLGQGLAPACFGAGVLIFCLFIFKYNVPHCILQWHLYTLSYVGTGFVLVSALLHFKPINAFLENHILVWIGRNSYGIYLWHYILLFPFVGVWNKLDRSGTVVLAYFMSSVLAGVLSTLTVERKFLALREKRIP